MVNAAVLKESAIEHGRKELLKLERQASKGKAQQLGVGSGSTSTPFVALSLQAAKYVPFSSEWTSVKN